MSETATKQKEATIGRFVRLHEKWEGKYKQLAAVITKVIDTTNSEDNTPDNARQEVNLCVFGEQGTTYPMVAVARKGCSGHSEELRFWEFPEY